jgi:hypothetical protein
MSKRDVGHMGPRGTVGLAQDGISTANLQQALETKGLTSANLAAALAHPPAAAPSPAPASPPPVAESSSKTGGSK